MLIGMELRKLAVGEPRRFAAVDHADICRRLPELWRELGDGDIAIHLHGVVVGGRFVAAGSFGHMENDKSFPSKFSGRK